MHSCGLFASRLLYLHADSRPSPRCSPDLILIAYLCLRPCVLFNISSSLPSLYFLSSIIIVLSPLNIALRNPELLSYSLDEVSDIGTLFKLLDSSLVDRHIH